MYHKRDDDKDDEDDKAALEIKEYLRKMHKNAPKNNTTENKAQVSLIPLDLIIPMLEPAYREGILKYQRESWRLGFNSTVMYDALMRHLTKWFFHLESNDPEAMEKFSIDKHHLGAAMFCLINLYNTEMNFPELDDRPLKFLEKPDESK